MTTPRRLKHLPEEAWPTEDRLLFDAAFADGDIFDDKCGAGAHLSAGTPTSHLVRLAALARLPCQETPCRLLLPAADRITLERVRAYVDAPHRRL